MKLPRCLVPVGWMPEKMRIASQASEAGGKTPAASNALRLEALRRFGAPVVDQREAPGHDHSRDAAAQVSLPGDAGMRDQARDQHGAPDDPHDHPDRQFPDAAVEEAA